MVQGFGGHLHGITCRLPSATCQFPGTHGYLLALQSDACPAHVAQRVPWLRGRAQAASVWHMGVSSGVGQYRGSAAVAISATNPSPYTRGYLFRASAASVHGTLQPAPKCPSNGQVGQPHLLAPEQDTH